MQQASTRWERLALMVILIVGIWLRFQHSNAIEYNIDQVYPIWQALQTLDEGELPLAGQETSVLFANPPLTGYFFVPVMALSRQPYAAYALTLVLNTLAIGLAYRALWRLMGTRPALIGATLFAINPWIIEDSRRTWVQSLAPFFVCLIFWALASTLTSNTRHTSRRILIALIGLALFAHTYLLAYVLVIPVGLLIVLYWWRIPKRPLIIGGMIFTGLMMLYGIGLARQREHTTRRAEDFAAGHAVFSDEALHHALRLVSGGGYAAVRGTQAPANDATLRSTLSDAIHIIWTLAVTLGIMRAGWVLWRGRFKHIAYTAGENDTALLLLVWFLLPILMMSYVSRAVHPFYLLLTVPAGQGLAAWGGHTLFASQPQLNAPHNSFTPSYPLNAKIRAGIVVSILGFTGIINSLNTIRFAQHTAAYPGEDLPETLPLAAANALGTRIREARTPGMAVFSAMQEWTPITLAGHVFRTEQMGGFDRATLIPQQGALYVCFQRDPENPLLPPLHADPVGMPLVLNDGTQIELWQAHQSDITITHPTMIPSDIDVSFVGWSLTGDLTPGTTATLDTYWRIETLHPERGIWSFAPFAHLLAADGTRVQSVVGSVISALTWQPGDLMVQRLAIDVPDQAAKSFTLQVGLFDGVRTRDDGHQGINAIFRIPEDEETLYTAVISLAKP